MHELTWGLHAPCNGAFTMLVSHCNDVPQQAIRACTWACGLTCAAACVPRAPAAAYPAAEISTVEQLLRMRRHG